MHRLRMADQYTKCQTMATNLLLDLESQSTRTRNSTAIIRSIMDTEKCDQYYDFKIVRESTEKHINDGDKTRMSRIIARDIKELDISVANEVLVEYRLWYLTALRKSLNWKYWFWYKFIERPNNLDMMVGASVIVGINAVLFGYSAKATFLSVLAGNAIVIFLRNQHRIATRRNL